MQIRVVHFNLSGTFDCWYLEGEENRQKNSDDEHATETDELQSLATSFLDDDQRDEGHQHIHATHSQRCVLGRGRRQIGRDKDVRRKVHHLSFIFYQSLVINFIHLIHGPTT